MARRAGDAPAKRRGLGGGERHPAPAGTAGRRRGACQGAGAARAGRRRPAGLPVQLPSGLTKRGQSPRRPTPGSPSRTGRRSSSRTPPDSRRPRSGG